MYAADDGVGWLWDPRVRLRDIPVPVVWGMKDPAFPARYLER